MTNKKKRPKSKPTSGQSGQEEQESKYQWIPLWGWVLIFLVPLVVSEYMFYVADRTLNMILFPIAWIGFWYMTMNRAGWPILKKGRKTKDK
jgi:hypothetical protein